VVFSNGGVALENDSLINPSGTFLQALRWPDDGKLDFTCIIDSIICKITGELTWLPKATVTSAFTGNTFDVDEVEFTTIQALAAFDGYSSGALTAADIPSFTIVNEVLETAAVPEPSSLFLLCSSLAGLAALARNGYRRRVADRIIR
jgi:hypothetical protein